MEELFRRPSSFPFHIGTVYHVFAVYIYRRFRELLTSVCTSPSPIWPLRGCLLSAKRTLCEFFQIFSRFPELLYTFIELLSLQERVFSFIFFQNYGTQKNVKTNSCRKKSQL